MKNVHIVFSYDGSKFVGYQIQNEGRTVQEELIKAVEKINGEKTKIDASGRTDRGVHALEQNACFKTTRTRKTETVTRAAKVGKTETVVRTARVGKTKTIT